MGVDIQANGLLICHGRVEVEPDELGRPCFAACNWKIPSYCAVIDRSKVDPGSAEPLGLAELEKNCLTGAVIVLFCPTCGTQHALWMTNPTQEVPCADSSSPSRS